MVHSQKKLYLVFEYLNQDLKKYMDSSRTGELPFSLIKVQSYTTENISLLSSAEKSIAKRLM